MCICCLLVSTHLQFVLATWVLPKAYRRTAVGMSVASSTHQPCGGVCSVPKRTAGARVRRARLHPVTLVSGTRLGPYEILGPIGSGAMGEVYRARDIRLGRDVAVKVLPEDTAQIPDRLARFEREAQAVAALNHPNIMALHDIGNESGIVYAVMELLEGETLRARLAAAGRLSPLKAINYASQIARGLAAAHERGSSPGSEAGESVRHEQAGEDSRLVSRSRERSGESGDATETLRRSRHRAGHSRLHVSRAGDRSACHRALRSVRVQRHRAQMLTRSHLFAGTTADTVTAILRGCRRLAVPCLGAGAAS